MVPVPPGDQQDLFGVEHIEPGLQGVDRLLEVIKTYFGHKIKRYILGQTLTSEADATGLGSGVSDAHLATFADIVAYDSRNLEETLSEEFVRHVQLWNFPQSAKHYLHFVIDTEAPDTQKRMEALKSAWDMGARIKSTDIMDIIGASMPTDEDPQVFNPQVVGGIMQMQQMQAGGGATPVPLAPSTPEQMTAIVAQAFQQGGAMLQFAG
jgi:phage gp29-like protein